MQRQSLRERVLDTKPRGKEVFFTDTDTTPTDNEQPSTDARVPFTVPDELFTEEEQRPTWNDLHQRVTFYCPKELIEKIESTMRASRKSKSQVIVVALNTLLNNKKRK